MGTTTETLIQRASPEPFAGKLSPWGNDNGECLLLAEELRNPSQWLHMPLFASEIPKTLRNFVFSAGRMAVSAIGSLIVSVVMARALGAKNMGIYTFLVWVSGTVAGLAALGLPDTVAKYVAEHKSKGEHARAAKIARRILKLHVLSAVAVSVLALIVWNALDSSSPLLIALAVSMILPTAIQQTLIALMEGEQRFDLQLLTAVAGSGAQVLLVAACAKWFCSVSGFLLANLAASIVSVALMFLLCRPMVNSAAEDAIDATEASELRKRMLSFSLAVYGMWLLNVIVWDKSELFFLKMFQSPAELAFYSIAFALTARLGSAGDSLTYVLFPMFVSRYTQHGEAELVRVYRKAMKFLQLLMVPAALWGMALARPIVLAMYGNQYARMIPVLQILLLTLLITTSMMVTSNVLYAMERQAAFLRCMVLIAALNVTLDLLLIPRMGAVGAALANGISLASAAVAVTVLLHRSIPGSFPVRDTAKIYLSSAVSAAPIVFAELVHMASWVAIAVSVLASVVLYCMLLVLVGTIARTDLEFATAVVRSRAAKSGANA